VPLISAEAERWLPRNRAPVRHEGADRAAPCCPVQSGPKERTGRNPLRSDYARCAVKCSVAQFEICGVLTAGVAADCGHDEVGAVHVMRNRYRQRARLLRRVPPCPLGDLRAELAVQERDAGFGGFHSGVSVHDNSQGNRPLVADESRRRALLEREHDVRRGAERRLQRDIPDLVERHRARQRGSRRRRVPGDLQRIGVEHVQP